MLYKFPKDFVFGATTSAFQVEGATSVDERTPCCWDEFLSNDSKNCKNTFSDFYHEFKTDIENCKNFNINCLQLSIAWTRIIKNNSGEVNFKGIAYYNNLINTCLENNITPFIALYHFDTPLYLFKKGDWLIKETSNHFINYAKICFKEFGDRVKHWITFKDPYTMLHQQYITGIFAPYQQCKPELAIQSMHNILLTHSQVVNLYKELYPKGKIGIALRLEKTYPASPTPANIIAAQSENTLTNEFLLDAVLLGKYKSTTLKKIQDILAYSNAQFKPDTNDEIIMQSAAKKIDFLGINYYTSHFIKHYNGKNKIFKTKHGNTGFALQGIGKSIFSESLPHTDWDWSILPQGLYDILLHIDKHYPKKTLYITENGIGLHEHLTDNIIADEKRIDYVRQHLNVVISAINKGIDIKGYFLWSLIDAYSWINGTEKRYGLFFVDYKTQKRYPKQSVFWYKNLAQKHLMLTANAIYKKE